MLEDIALNSTSEIARVRAISMLLEMKEDEPSPNAFDEVDEMMGVSRLYGVKAPRMPGRAARFCPMFCVRSG